VDAVQGTLLIIAAIFLIGIAGELVFERTGVPDVVWLIGVGIFLGPLTGLLPREQLLRVSPEFGAVTLVIVLFHGGLSLRLSDLGRSAPRAAMLSLLTFLVSMAAVAPASMVAARLGILPEGWTWMHGLLLGSIVGGTSALVIMPLVEKAKLDAPLGNLLNLESAFTDILCVVVAGALIQLLKTGTADVGHALLELLRAFGIGLVLGGAAGFVSLRVLKRLKGAYAYPTTLAALMLLYVVVDVLGGSPALAILAAAVVVGNAPALAQSVGASGASLGRGVTGVHHQMTFMVKSFFFTLIGALLGAPLPLMALGAAIAVLLLIVRWPAVRLALLRSGHSREARGLLWMSLPRGMAAGVLSMMPMQAGIPSTDMLPGVVFVTATVTIAFFAGGFRYWRPKLAPPPAASLTAPAQVAAEPS
jgi:cell volume regulation protein A